MIVDLNLKGRHAVVFGGGREAVRKVDALLTQDCRVTVVAESVDEELRRWAAEKKIDLLQRRVENGDCLRQFDNLLLVIAATDDASLNRRLVETAKALCCYAYAVDDPEHSDFRHPAVINLYDTVQIAVSTQGKSPLMAGKIRDRIEPVLRNLVTREDILQIRLQEKMRTVAKHELAGADARKRFLVNMLQDEEIKSLLEQGKLKEAETAALNKLQRG
ncbi:MAG: bifunctional precorrin-2 dehydrogenase/sirohydrochlorin ferrochelatase [Nitrospinales bacterium]